MMHLFRAFALATLTLAAGLHPRPAYDQRASFARWLVHESDYAIGEGRAELPPSRRVKATCIVVRH